MNVLLHLTPEQAAWVDSVAQKTGQTHMDVLRWALERGAAEIHRKLDQVPPAPRRLQLVR